MANIFDVFNIKALLNGMEARIMANLEGIDTALGNLSDQIKQLADQVSALNANDVTQEQLDDIAARINAAADQVDQIIEPDAGETPAG